MLPLPVGGFQAGRHKGAAVQFLIVQGMGKPVFAAFVTDAVSCVLLGNPRSLSN